MVVNYARNHPDDGYDVLQLPGRYPDDDIFDVRKAVALVWRAKWKMALGALLGVTLAGIQIAAMRPAFTATGTVLFSPERRNIVDLEDVLALPAGDGLQNQIAILRSTNLMSRIVERLELYDSAEFNPLLPQPEGWLDRVRPWFSWESYVPWSALAKLGLIGQPPSPAPQPAEVRRDLGRIAAREALRRVVALRPVKDSRVIDITATTHDPALSSRIVNTISQEYITAQLDAKLAATRDATLWLTARVEELRAEVEAAEAAVASYTAELATRTGQTTAVLQQQLDSLNAGLADASAKRSGAEIRYGRARDGQQDTDRIASVSEFQDSAVITESRRAERQLVSDRAALARLVPDGHERLQMFDTRIDGVRADIRSEAVRIVGVLESEVRVTTAEEADFRAKVATLEARLQAQSAQEVRLRQLEREADASRLIYGNFLGRLKETTQQEKLEDADAVVLSPAEPPRSPDVASKKRAALLGLLLGGTFGFAVALVIERLQNTFRDLGQITEATGLTVLGTVPLIGSGLRRVDVLDHMLQRPGSPLAEAIRSLRTSILFSRLDQPPQVVMFTSTVPGEGKSTTSLLLALASAQMGKSAIIVDCDLRRPALNRVLGDRGVMNAGLRGILDGSLTLGEACITDPATGLAILSGQPDEFAVINAADVLSSDRFGDLLLELRENYDLVILDAPPTLSVTDARIISQRVDTTLYLIRWDATSRDTVLEGLREFRLVTSNIVGAVATMVNVEKARRYGYGGRRADYLRREDREPGWPE